MIEKRLRSGLIAYYWSPHKRDITAGFTLHREGLGTGFGSAVARAEVLNQHLDHWQRGEGATRPHDAQPGYLTLHWLVQRCYAEFHKWRDKVSARSRPEYLRAHRIVLDLKARSGARIGDYN